MTGRNTPARRVWARRAGAGFTALMLAGSAVVAVQAGRQAWRLEPILSGSMEPALSTGALALSVRVPAMDLRVGDVLVYQAADGSSGRIAHRIMALRVDDEQVVVRTQGDANPAPDGREQTLVGASAYRVQGAVPLLGYPAVYLRSGQLRLAVLGAAVLLLLYGLFPARSRSIQQEV